MSLFHSVKAAIRHARLARFAPPEKRALVRLAYAFAFADEELADDELAAAQALAKDVGVDFSDAIDLGVPEAVAILQATPSHLELALLACVDVIFADGDYDKAEHAFVTDFSKKYGIAPELLVTAAQKRAQKTVDHALDEWHHEILAKKM
jgi:hypothetical protein